MARMREIGASFDKGYRDDLNYNFGLLEALIGEANGLTDALRQEMLNYINNLQQQINILTGENIDELLARLNDSIQQALTAAQEARTAKTATEEATALATAATELANASATLAEEKAIYANEKAVLAQEAADNANQEASNLSQLKINVVQATQDANEEANNANEKATLANNAADRANQAADNANEASSRANLAADAIEGWATAEQWVNDKQYAKNNVVTDNGSTWQALRPNIGVTPSEGLDWTCLARKGLDGTGAVSSVNNRFPGVDGNVEVKWGDVPEKPTTFPPTAHTHDIENVNELQSILNSKAKSADVALLEQSVTKHFIDVEQRGINVRFPPSPLVAAVGDGIVNDQPAIQAIIDYANVNKCNIYIPNGTYRLNDTLKRKGNVSIYGQSMILTNLKFYKTSGGAVIDTVNEPLHGVAIQGLKITKDVSAGGTIGILGGSTLQKYNSAIGQFKDITMEGLTYGIMGNGEPSGVGIFDCLFENLFVSNCFVGIRFEGSGNILKHARITHCDTGVSFEYLNTESFAGVNIIGGVFVQNTYDIGIPNTEGIRTCSFNGTWFEQATNGIINIPKADTRIMSLSFRDCMLSINGTFPLMNFYNAIGGIKIDTCTVAQAGTSSVDITPPYKTEGLLKVTNTLKIMNNGTRSILNYSKNNDWEKIILQSSWVDVAENTYTKYFKTDDNIVHLQIGMKDGNVTNGTVVGNLPSGFRPSQSVRFPVYDVTNLEFRNMYISTNGDVVISGTDNKTGTWSGYISFKAI